MYLKYWSENNSKSDKFLSVWLLFSITAICKHPIIRKISRILLKQLETKLKRSIKKWVR